MELLNSVDKEYSFLIMNEIQWYKLKGLHLNIDDGGNRIIRLYDVVESNNSIYYRNGFYTVNAIVLKKCQYTHFSEFKLYYDCYNKDKKELSRLKLKHR